MCMIWCDVQCDYILEQGISLYYNSEYSAYLEMCGLVLAASDKAACVTNTSLMSDQMFDH